ncbi:hypothetical protein [Pedobacter suwonensis]|uniref:hypothetical protein n=1 Tax=Pedobacter suwonensis TaxID=332999 RepID=UPI00382665DA
MIYGKKIRHPRAGGDLNATAYRSCASCDLLSAIGTMLPASQIFAGKSTEIFAPPLHTPQPKAGSKRERWNKARAKSLDAAAIKISVGFYKEGCKPWVFVTFGSSQK